MCYAGMCYLCAYQLRLKTGQPFIKVGTLSLDWCYKFVLITFIANGIAWPLHVRTYVYNWPVVV